MIYGSVCSGIEAATMAWHPNMRDLSGLRVGRMMVTAPTRRDNDGHVMWLCLCGCGNVKEIASNSLTRRNPSLSCGCMNADTAQTRKKSGGAWNEGKSYSIHGGEHCYKTRHGWAKAAIRHYGNVCERCGWDKSRCDVHHREPKSEGGLHTLGNAVVLCPNCHRTEHEGAT